MAIRQTKAGTWQVYWRNPITGKQESKTYKTRKEAKKENSLILYRINTDPESFIPNNPKGKTLAQVCEEYLQEKNMPTDQHKSYVYRMRISVNFLGDKRISEITNDDLETLKKHIVTTATVCQASIHSFLTTIKSVIEYAKRKKYISESIKFPRIEAAIYQKFVPPSYEEVQILYNAASPHIKRVIILGAYFGIRVGQCEMFKLTWNDVDLEKKIIRVHGSKKNIREQYREVPIKESLLPLILQWKEEDAGKEEYLVHYRGKPLKYLKTAWKYAIKRSGIKRRIRPYDLRHMYGTQLIASGVDVGTIAELMGHSNPVMLLTHYQYVMKSQKRSAVESLQDVKV